MTTNNQNENEMRAQECERQAAEYAARREKSFDRCDTDGFLSQWADGIHANKMRLQAEIERNGGKASFPALFDLEGNRVPAKLITVADRFRGYGTRNVWAIVDPETGKFTGKFVNPSTGGKRSIANLEAKGYREGREMAPAKADIIGTGRGLSGSAWAATVRTDRGWPEAQ